jgi:hypothetical protein
MASWKQTTWYIFHMFTLNFQEDKKEHYQTFFSSFKVLLPCDICINHYREQLNIPGLRLRENMTKEKLVYGVAIDECNNIEELTDMDIIERGEKTGIVYSIGGFIDELNHDQLDTENYWFKII